MKKNLGVFGPLGRYEEKKKKAHTSQTRGDTKYQKEKKIKHLSHAHSNSKAAAGVDHVATQQHRQGTHHR